MTGAVIVVLGVILFCLLAVAYWRGHWAGMKAGVRGAKDEILGARGAFEHARAQWEDWERKAESFRALNSSVLLERDKWQALYTEQSIAHGNAQAIMMGAIEYMGKQLSIAGVPFQIPPVLDEVRQQFIHRHVTQAIPDLDTGYPQVAKSSEKSDQVG